jgi:periplasmic mercuric ion binding protein
MTKLLTFLILSLLVSTNPASAAERTVTLTVDNMYCEACPYIVRKTLEHVSGVSKVSVSFKEKIAVVVFDDTKTSVKDLTGAVAKAGFPSALKS